MPINPVQSGVVPLHQSRGLAYRFARDYQPGEFAQLYNCMITPNGTIRQRAGVGPPSGKLLPHTDTARSYAKSYKFPSRFLGSIGSDVIVGSTYKNVAGTPGGQIVGYAQNGRDEISRPDLESIKIYNPDGSLFVDAATVGTLWHPFQMDGVFRYNDRNYFLSSGMMNSAAPVKKAGLVTILRSISGSESGLPADRKSFPASTTDYEAKIINDVDLTNDNPAGLKSALPQIQSNGNDFNFGLPVLHHFIHKDRVWAVLATKLLFSKATDPWEWQVSQDGGFVSMADAEINYAIPKDDGIYIFSDNTIDYFTYSTSPNVDGSLTRIATNMGAHSAVEHKGSVYFVNQDSLYEIRGTVVSKVLDLEINMYSAYDIPSYWRIYSYYDYLIIESVINQSYNLVAADDPNYYIYLNGYSIQQSPSGVFINNNHSFGTVSHYYNSIFFINSETGSISSFGYEFLPSGSSFKNDVCELFVAGLGEKTSSQTLWMLCKPWANSLGIGSFDYGSVVFMDPEGQFRSNTTSGPSSDVNVSAWDNVNSPTLKIWPGYAEIILEGFMPDGFEYNYKKFRSFLIESYNSAALTAWMQVDGDNVGSTSTLIGPGNEDLRPEPFRIGINARGRSFAIKLTLGSNPLIEDSTQNSFEIVDMRLFWTYVNYGSISRT